MDAIIKRPSEEEKRRRLHIEAMWLAFLRAPRKAEPDTDGMYDLSEIGTVRIEAQRIDRDTPYSVARGLR